MRAFLVRLRAEEPLVITSGSAESMSHETLGHIPGNMLLGAFAAIWKRAHPDVDPDDCPDFQRLFLGGVSWGAAVPLCSEEAGVPVPRCYMRIKNRRGLPRAGEKADGHVVVNMLRIGDDDELPELLRKRKILGPEDVVKLKKIGAAFMGRKNMRLAEERRGWNIHVTLGSRRSALDGHLFGYSSIISGTGFLCRIVCRDGETEQALRELLTGTSCFHVGRSRSAGYGRVRLLEFAEEGRDTKEMKLAAEQETAIYLHSHYMPSPSWLSPVESLLAELELVCGGKPELKKLFCSYVNVQGYNALWQKPRASRMALEQGSVLLCAFDREVQLPRRFMLGADQAEGYGRMELEPEFLASLFPAVPENCATASRPAAVTPVRSPMWNNVRRRAVNSLCEERACELLRQDDWQEFVKTAAENEHPGASQRGNIRRIVTERPSASWQEAFRAMLADSRRAKELWEHATAFSPFSRRREYLNVIMTELLSAERAKNFLPGPELPGGRADGDALRSAGEKAHRIFLLRLLAAWNYACPGREEGRN